MGFGVWCLLGLAARSHSLVAPKNVHVAIEASWNSTSLLLEAAEFFAANSNNDYWRFVTQLTQRHGTSPSSDKQEYDLSLSIAADIVGEYTVTALKQALALRTHSPKVELHRNIFLNVLTNTELATCHAVLAVNQVLSCYDDEDYSESSKSDTPEAVYPHDHVYGTSPCLDRTPVVLYANLIHKDFAKVHEKMVQETTKHGLCYILRPLVPASSHGLVVQGFAVELAIKNMEYKAIDDAEINDVEAVDLSKLLAGGVESDVRGFYFKTLAQRKPELASQLEKMKEELLGESSKEAELNAWDLKEIGLQATQSIVNSKDPLALLKDMSQNFPVYSPALVRVKITPKTRKAFKTFPPEHMNIEPEQSYLAINGKQVNIDDFNIFKVHNMLRNEASAIDSFRALDLPPMAIKGLMRIQHAGAQDVRVSMSDLPQSISYLNNIQTEAKYSSWGSSIRELTNPGWPNQLRYVRKNLYTAIAIFDPSTAKGLALFERSQYFVNANVPMRFGLCLYLPSYTGASATGASAVASLAGDKEYASLLKERKLSSEARKVHVSELIARAFYVLDEEYKDEGAAVSYLAELASSVSDISQSQAETAFKKVLKARGDADDAPSLWKKVTGDLGKSPSTDKSIAATQQWLAAKHFENMDSLLVVNGVASAVSSQEDFRQQLMNSIISEQWSLIQKAHSGEIDDFTKFPDYFNNLPGVIPSANKEIIDGGVRIPGDLGQLPSFLKYHTNQDPDIEFGMKIATYWCVVDFSTTLGLDLAIVALEHVQKTKTRMAFVLNPADSTAVVSKEGALLSAMVSELKPGAASAVLLDALKVVKDFSGQKDLLHKALDMLLKSVKLPKKFQESLPKHHDIAKAAIEQHHAFAASLGLAAGKQGVVMNGRLFYVDNSSATNLPHDFALMDWYATTRQSMSAVHEVFDLVAYPSMDPDDVTAEFVDNKILRAVHISGNKAPGSAASTLSTSPPRFGKLSSNDIGVIEHSSPTALMAITAVLDPLSPAAQVVSPFLLSMRDMFDVSITVILNPKVQTQQPPLKRFYTVSNLVELSFDDVGALATQQSGAWFRNLRSTQVLTMAVFSPETWLVFSSKALYDLDNVRLSEVKSETMSVTYSLKHLLAAGQCFEADAAPPAGLQLDLAAPGKNAQVVADTLVMQNLGYFQLKANPGIWKLSLHGAANTVFKISDAEVLPGDEYPSTTVMVTSFDDEMSRLAVERQSGMAGVLLEDVTIEDDQSKGVGLLGKIFGLGKKNREGETIHVFSVASGHLYERFLKIMMLSVLESTKSPVKFWFIENFFSPQFKEFVQDHKHMFDVEFVTYKWPLWLRRQTEKQRIIWGYKILFLDVLFPLNVPRIIYIDADQVVRGDIAELWNLELSRGAPYAYTPFCDSNEETEGFRFWKQGYWKDHLRNRPYHISALYVVDLHRFRRMRAGDKLRSIYDNLSADPNSLANLDQDLPNYAQHMVPIHSLPQEWLWCQAWCSMDTLASAKTIDLCNNPLTKRPKLEVAKELLPEWEVFDNRAKSLEDKHAAVKSKEAKNEL